MASKLIHICDRCKSYVDDQHIVPLEITLKVPSSVLYKSDENTRALRWTNTIRQRELCVECAKDIANTFGLAQDDTSEDLFADFKLPTRGEESSGDKDGSNESFDDLIP